MKEDLVKFLERAKENKALAEELNAIKEPNQRVKRDKIISLADEYGFELTQSDFEPDDESALKEWIEKDS